jgi:S1-C subfamily serine protease
VATSATAAAGEPETVTLEVGAAAAKGDVGFSVQGVVVDKVSKAGLAEKRGIRAGWYVVRVAAKAVASEAEVQAALAAAKKAGKAFAIVFRVGRSVGPIPGRLTYIHTTDLHSHA